MKTVDLFWDEGYSEYFDDLLIQANKGRVEKEKLQSVEALMILKVREWLESRYPAYLSWLPTRSFGGLRVDVDFNPCSPEDLSEEKGQGKLVKLGLTGRTVEKLCKVLPWGNEIQKRLSMIDPLRNPGLFFEKPSEMLKNVIVENLQPLLREIEKTDRDEEEKEGESE